MIQETKKERIITNEATEYIDVTFVHYSLLILYLSRSMDKEYVPSLMAENAIKMTSIIRWSSVIHIGNQTLSESFIHLILLQSPPSVNSDVRIDVSASLGDGVLYNLSTV